MTRKLAAAALTLGLALLPAACSSDSHKPEPTSLTTLCSKLGGNFTEEPDQHELYTSDQGNCGTYTMRLFADQSQRDSWLKVARTFGDNFVVGPDWVITNDDPGAAASARRVLGGSS